MGILDTIKKMFSGSKEKESTEQQTEKSTEKSTEQQN